MVSIFGFGWREWATLSGSGRQWRGLARDDPQVLAKPRYPFSVQGGPSALPGVRDFEGTPFCLARCGLCRPALPWPRRARWIAVAYHTYSDRPHYAPTAMFAHDVACVDGSRQGSVICSVFVPTLRPRVPPLSPCSCPFPSARAVTCSVDVPLSLARAVTCLRYTRLYECVLQASAATRVRHNA